MQIVSKQLYSIKQGNSVLKQCAVLLWPDETSSLILGCNQIISNSIRMIWLYLSHY